MGDPTMFEPEFPASVDDVRLDYIDFWAGPEEKR